MNHVLVTVIPIFGLIALGFIVAKFRILPKEATKGLVAFVFTIAMPSLLFRTMVTVERPDASTTGLLLSFMGATAVTWILATLLTRWPLRRPSIDSASIGMGSAFGNTVMMGIPLVVGYYGEAALTPLAVIIAIHAPVLWFVATMQIEWVSRGRDVPILAVLKKLFADLARNPVILGIVLGSFWRMTGLGLHPVPEKMITMLGDAGIPGALFALGMSQAQYEIRGQVASLCTITILKLFIMPIVAWLLAAFVFALPPLWVGVVVLLAAVPTGANAFLFADRYETAVGSVSGSIALGTLLSAATISGILLILSP